MADENVPKGKGTRPDYKTPLNACMAGVVAANTGPRATGVTPIRWEPPKPGEFGFSAADGTKDLGISADGNGNLNVDVGFRDASFASQSSRIVDGHVVGSNPVKGSRSIGIDGKVIPSQDAAAPVEKATNDVKKCMDAVVPSRKTTPAP